jgi:hypothetical protein
MAERSALCWKGAGDPLNLMRVMPTKGARFFSHAIPMHGFLFIAKEIRNTGKPDRIYRINKMKTQNSNGSVSENLKNPVNPVSRQRIGQDLQD